MWLIFWGAGSREKSLQKKHVVDCKNLRRNQQDIESPQGCESTTLRYDDMIHDPHHEDSEVGPGWTCAAGFGGVGQRDARGLRSSAAAQRLQLVATLRCTRGGAKMAR